MKSRSEIKAEAKKLLSANYGAILGEMLLVGILTGLAGIVVVGSIIVGPPLMVGFYEGIRLLWQGKKKEKMFTGFEEGKFGRSIGGMILMAIFIWLWSLLFIIPGIIKSFAYCLTPFIISDSKGISATDAITLSKKITKGYKGELFVFCLSYIGWFLLSGLTFGLLAIFYVGPYMATAFGGYYLELKNKALADGVVTLADFGVAEEIAAEEA
jgi:uncharacterized membrane protein